MADRAIEHWAVQAEQCARCLVATIPAYMDAGYGEVAARFIDGRPPIVDDSHEEGTWLRTGLGYAFIGPAGGPHFYTRTRPDGVADVDMKEMPTEPPGRLYGELDRAVMTARGLAAGEVMPVALNGQSLHLACEPADREKMAALAELLAGALAAASPGYNKTILASHAGQMMTALSEGRTPAQALQVSYLAVQDLRAHHAADGWLVAVTATRALLASFLPDDAPGRVPLISKSIESMSSGHDPERFLRRVVLDYAAAGKVGCIVKTLDLLLARAREAKDAALAAASVTDHVRALSLAAQIGFTGWLLADLMLRGIPAHYWTDRIAAAKLNGYVATAEETVVRSAVALEVGCVNLATRAALDAHIAEVKQRGAAWADELIEQYWYYPRNARDLLLDLNPTR